MLVNLFKDDLILYHKEKVGTIETSFTHDGETITFDSPLFEEHYLNKYNLRTYIFRQDGFVETKETPSHLAMLILAEHGITY